MALSKLERLHLMVAELRDRGLLFKQKEIADRLNTTPSVVSSAMHGNEVALTTSFLRRLNEAYGGIFSSSWLLSGTGDMIASADTAMSVDIDLSHHNASDNSIVVDGSDDSAIVALRVENEVLKKEIAALRATIEELRDDKRNLNSTISALLAR